MTTTISDAWHMLVPPTGDEHGPLSPMLLVLTVVTGLVDAFSYLGLGHVFVANMTGNVLFLAFALAGAKGFSFAASLFALGAFVLGAVVSGWFTGRLGVRRGRMLATSTALEAALVLAATILGWCVTAPGEGGTRYVLVVLLGLAAGMQNGTARKLAVPDITTTVLTMTITGAASDSRLAGGSNSRIGRRGMSVLAMFSGAIIGAFLILHVSSPLTLVVASVLLVPVAITAAGLSASHPVWDAAS